MHRTIGGLLLLLSFYSIAQTAAPKKPLHIICPPPSPADLVIMVKPKYPKDAVVQKIKGPVVFDVVINRLGEPKAIKFKKGDPLLAPSALDALRQWRWKPYKLNGEPVEIETTVTINFDLLKN